MCTEHKHMLARARRLAVHRKYFLARAKIVYRVGLEEASFRFLFEMVFIETDVGV